MSESPSKWRIRRADLRGLVAVVAEKASYSGYPYGWVRARANHHFADGFLIEHQLDIRRHTQLAKSKVFRPIGCVFSNDNPPLTLICEGGVLDGREDGKHELMEPDASGGAREATDGPTEFRHCGCNGLAGRLIHAVRNPPELKARPSSPPPVFIVLVPIWSSVS